VRWVALSLLFSTAASAAANDLQLWKLGHPDPLGCTACNGSVVDGPEAGDPQAQTRFHKLASTLGLAFAPPFQDNAGTIGQSGFEVGVSSTEAFLKIPGDAWATTSGAAPSVLTLPAVVVRKGLGGSFELAVAVNWLGNSQMMGLSAELRWAAIDGIDYAPDVAVRAWGTRVVGTAELDLAMAGADVMLSKSFAVAGMMKLQPYGTFGLELVNALSNVVDFKPAVENQARPGLDDGLFHNISMIDNRYLRGSIGLRVVAGVVVLGLEGAVGAGTNPVQSDKLAGGTAAPQDFVRLWTLSGRLGFGF